MPLDATSFDFSDTPPREEGALRTLVLYNAFNPADRQIVDVEWREDKTVAEYLGELEGRWVVVLGNRELTPGEWATTTATLDDTLVIAQAPGDGKSILKIVLMIAIVAAAFYLGPIAAAGILGAKAAGVVTLGTIITATIIAAGGMLINALLPDAPPKASDSESSRSYGLDGAQTTSREEISVPILYGEFRVAGNRINIHIENDPDGLNQTYFAQYAVSEGPIEGIDSFEVNDQPIGNFQNVEIQTRLGGLDQQPINWFERVVVPNFDGRTLSSTPTIYDTKTQVDKLRLDLLFPQGLYSVDKKKGDRRKHTVNLIANATNLATGQVYPISAERWVQTSLNGPTFLAQGTRGRATVRVRYVAPGDFNIRVVILDGADNVLIDQREQGTLTPVEPGTIFDGEGNTFFGEEVASQRDFVYEFNSSGFTPTNFKILIANDNPAAASHTVPSVEVLGEFADLAITRSERTALRISIASGPLPRGFYRVSIRRTNNTSTDDSTVDKVDLSTVNEITNDVVNYVRTASYGVKLRLTDQLSNEPNITARVRGRKVKIYDSNGGVTTEQWSNNPADVMLDMLLSEDWERSFSPSRIDFPSFSRWRAACLAKGLTFNGTFDSRVNLWDALMLVCRIGRANLVVMGTKWSIILEAPSEPVMVFGDHNIISGSFRTEWLGREGRANRIEVQYYDREDRNKRKSVFATDEAALARDEAIRDSTINLIGVDNVVQAQAEADLQLRLNQAIVQGCSFRTYLDGLGCLPGDVIRVQHTMPAWGWATRVKAVNGNTISLESPLAPAGVVEPGQGSLPTGTWRIMVARAAIQRASMTVSAASGALITVTGVYQGTDTLPVRRIVIGGNDYRVLQSTVLGGSTVFSLDQPVGNVVGQTAQLWATELLQEGGISQPTAWASTVTLSSWTHGALQEGDQVLIGRQTQLGKLFRIKSFGYSTDQDRTLECMEYDPWVYDPSGNNPASSASELQPSPLQVVGLKADSYSVVQEGGTSLYYGRAGWSSPLNDRFGHMGARVYVSRDNEDFYLHEEVPVGRSESSIEATPGETIRFKVVAYTETGGSASYNTAPIVSVFVRSSSAPPEMPLDLQAIGGSRQINVSWRQPSDSLAVAYWTVYQSQVGADFSTVSITNAVNTNSFVAAGLMPQTDRWFWVQAFGFNGAASPVAGPVMGTTLQLTEQDIQDGIINTAKFAQSLEPVTLVTEGGVPTVKSTEVIFHTPTNQLYRWDVETNSYVRAVRTEDLAGVLADAQIESLAASKITGVIEESQIAAITASKITGQLSDEQVESISAAKIAGQLSDEQIASVSAAKLSGAIESSQIASIEAAKLTGSITSTQISDNAITAPKIQAGSIETAKLAVGAVTADTIAANAITAAKIEAGAIGTAKLAAGAVTADTIATNAITAAKIEAGAISTAKLAVGAVTADTIATNAVVAAKIQAGSVETAKIAVGAIDADRIATNAISAVKIQAGAIETAKIATGAINADKIAANSISADKIQTNAITSDKILANSIIAGKIQAGAVRSDEIAAGAIVASKLASTELITLSAQIGNGVIINAKIGDLQVDTIKIAGDAVTSAVSSVRNDILTGSVFGTVYYGILEVNIFLPNGRETHVSVDIAQNYSGGANAWTYVLYHNGNEAARRSNPYGSYSTTISMSWAGFLGPGGHNFRVDTDLYTGVSAANRAILVLGRAR
jgi:sulfur carrier protein ThiS